MSKSKKTAHYFGIHPFISVSLFFIVLDLHKMRYMYVIIQDGSIFALWAEDGNVPRNQIKQPLSEHGQALCCL